MQLKPPQSELAVDCEHCQVRPPLKRTKAYSLDVKCCDFSPFISCFAFGELIQTHPAPFALLGDDDNLIWTKLGVVHHLRHRKDRRVCGFFDNGQCLVWQQRPATCYSFYCASQQPETWSSLEDRLLAREVDLLKSWFFYLGLSDSLWRQWGEFMDWDAQVSIPEELVITNRSEAISQYLKSREWLKSLASEQKL